MKIYWSIKSIPEIAALPAQERKARWEIAFSRTRKNWRAWLALLACAVIGGLGALVGRELNIGVAVALFAGALGGFVLWQLLVAITRKHSREILLGNPSPKTPPPNA